MAWLAAGVGYSLVYLAVGWLLRESPSSLLWFRIGALLLPPLTGVWVIARRRHAWSGCQWLFWGTMALGLMMSAIGLIGWTVDDLMLDRKASWLGWHMVFALFGGIAPLLALLAQPHRGRREELMATTAVDITGIAVMTGFLYSHFVVNPDLTPITAQRPSLALLLLCEFQQLLVCAGLAAAAMVARHLPWGPTYRRLAIGMFVNLVILSVSNVEIWQGLYRPGFVYDVFWILPFAFFPWAAALAPASDEAALDGSGGAEVSRPWIVFTALALIPILDFGLRGLLPLGALDQFRDLFMAITIFSVLPLLMARLAVERDETRQTDRKRRLLAAATEQADDLISITTPDERIEHANSAFCRTLGYELTEVVGRPRLDLLSDESHQAAVTVADTVRRDGVWRGTLIRRRRNASTFLSSGTVVALSEKGRLTHFVTVEHDVTKENERRDQLIHSERLAAAGQLVAGVAHELNNPLQAIIGFTELLLAAERRAESRSDLQQIHAQATRAAKIVRNLLAFVRRSGSERLVTNINEIVRNTVALRAYELVLHNIVVEEQYAEGLPEVLANREEIQQVVLNLILNAEQAIRSNRAGGRLQIRTAAGDRAVEIEVHDDGPGIPPALAGRVFEPFFSTKEVGQGTGLGLSIALGIVEAHGGSLTLQPAPVGACFRLTLPATTPQRAATPEEPMETDARRAFAGRRALVAGDEPPSRLLLKRLLEMRGFVVDVAEEDKAVTALVERQQYDIIFCDVALPGTKLRGLALFDELRASRPELGRALVLITSGVGDARLEQARAQDKIPLLPKPFSAVDVDSLVDRLVGNRRASDPLVGGRRVTDRPVSDRSAIDADREDLGIDPRTCTPR